MRILTGHEAEVAEKYLRRCAEVARQKAFCRRSNSLRGIILVQNEKTIAEGWNSPPASDPKCEKCGSQKMDGERIARDDCRAIHAEQRAVIDALRSGYRDLSGSRMYHLEVKDGKIVKADSPSCTICSRLLLLAGVSEFVLWLEDGIALYGIEELNDLSWQNKKW